MRIKIGPYKNWFGPYQLAEKILFWIPKQVDEYGIPHTHPKVHKFGEWLATGKIAPEDQIGDVVTFGSEDEPTTWLHKFLIFIDKRRKRKVKVHIDDYDVWSMDHTLSLIVAPMLRKMKESLHGAPHVDDEDVPDHLKSSSAPELSEDEINRGSVDDLWFKRWEWVLDEMIFAFDASADGNYEEQFYSGSPSVVMVKQEDGNYVMEKSPDYSFEVDEKGLAAFQARMANGFRLFGKYYQNLWT